jgi:hypothetical protein
MGSRRDVVHPFLSRPTPPAEKGLRCQDGSGGCTMPDSSTIPVNSTALVPACMAVASLLSKSPCRVPARTLTSWPALLFRSPVVSPLGLQDVAHL